MLGLNGRLIPSEKLDARPQLALGRSMELLILTSGDVCEKSLEI